MAQRLIITCGGTGGHFYPGLSIARTFQARGGEVLLLLSGMHSRRQAEIAAEHQINSVVLPDMPSPGRAPFAFLQGLYGGYRKAKQEVRAFSPQAVLGMGSFAQLPIILAALRNRIPVFLHDGNARIGRANRILSRFARFLGVGFPPVNAGACHCPVAEIGMPVRPELLRFQSMTKEEALRQLATLFHIDFSPELPVILIFGGSQGAAIFNEKIPAALKKIPEKFQVFHLTGKGKLEATRQAYGEASFPHLLLESSEFMAFFLSAADLIFCRSGGSTLAELALFGKPAVLIPYPYASEGHQSDNAACFTSAGAALSVRNEEFTTEKAEEILQNYFLNPSVWSERAAVMRSLARPDASEAMLEKIFGR